MESLGEILKRLTANGLQRQLEPMLLNQAGMQSEQSVEQHTEQLTQTSQCPSCSGSGWVSHSVPLDHPDFGEAFPCPECVKVIDVKKILTEKFSASFPHKKNQKTWENFQQNNNFRSELFENVRTWADDEGRTNLLALVGPHGTGKSHCLEALGREFNGRGIPTQYHNMSRLMVTFRAELGNKPPDLDKHYRALAQPDLLIIDDITEYGTEYSAQVLTEILEPRYNGRGLMAVGTNLTQVTMAEIWGMRLADRIFDIHSGDTELIYTHGPSYRSGTTWDQQTRKGWRRGG